MPKTENRNLISTQKARQKLRKELINAIECERLRRGLEKTSFCFELGINSKTYGCIVNGDGERVTLDTLMLYAIRMSIPVGIIVAGETIEIRADGSV